MAEPNYSAMPRSELVRRLELARTWGRTILEQNRSLAARVAEIERSVADLARDIERAAETLSNLLGELEVAAQEDVDPFEVSEQIRDALADLSANHEIFSE